jgi:gluconate 5-dehydrogenase
MYEVPGLSETLDRIVDRERSIDVLVNNAHELRPGTGFNVPEGSLEAATLETWMRNLIGGIYWAALTTQKLGARMKQQLAGSIINISTMYAWLPRDRNSIKARNSLIHPNTPAAKAGLLSFTRYVAIVLGAGWHSGKCNSSRSVFKHRRQRRTQCCSAGQRIPGAS